MIQILGLRTRFDEKRGKDVKYDAFFKENWRAPDVKTLLQNYEQYVEQIPEKDRWNIYYTALTCGPEKRQWKEQHVLPFDIDGLKITDTPNEALPFQECGDYIAVVCDALKIDYQDTAVIFSGNGLQFIIGLKDPITEEKFFDETREHYKTLCNRINYALAQAGLPGKADPSVHSPARLLRMPGTANRKPGKPERFARLLHAPLTAIDFDLRERSGLPSVAPTDQIPEAQFKKFLRADTQAVLQGCDFLKHMKDDPNSISEPQWYAGLSILGRLDQGTQLAHEYSQGHKAYTHAETEEKLEQALKVSGPRTCSNISNLWDGCPRCPNWKVVNSPISIKGPDFIKTQDQGFHDLHFDGNGKLKGKPVPNYEDLRKFFEKDHLYKILGDSRICYVWDGKRYRELGDAYLENFAQSHFNPYATTEMVGEFRRVVQRTNLFEPHWWDETTSRKINFQNGVLDLDTMELAPHSPDRGFRYVLEYGYDAKATCPNFNRFMHDITGNDDSLQALLLEFAGYALSNDTCWAQKALILEGHGSNGKSTFMNVLRALAGKDNYSSLTLGDLRHEGNRQMLDGKLFNMAEETPSKAVLDSTHFKNLVSGGETQVRQIYKKPYVMRNRSKLIFACNELPQAADTTHGFFRRFLIVPFRARFAAELGNVDPFIEKKLLAELPGIFNLVMEGYWHLARRQGFHASESAEAQIEQYRRDVDTVLAWMEENLACDPLPRGEPASDEPRVVLHEAYAEYVQATERGGQDPVTAIAFGKKLAHLIPDYSNRLIKAKVSGKAERVLRFSRLINAAQY